MKLTKSALFSVALASSFCVISCGEKKDAASGDSDGAAAVVKKDTPDSLTDEMIVQMGAFSDAIMSAKDKASSEAAVKKIEGVSDKIDGIAARLDKLETPSEEEKIALDEKMDKSQDAMKEKMGAVMPTIMQNPEVGEIIGPALQKFAERMKSNDKVFKRFGKK